MFSGEEARLQAGQPHIGFGRGSFYFRSRGSPWNLNTNPDHPLRRNFCGSRQPATASHFCFASWPRFPREDISFWRFIFGGSPNAGGLLGHTRGGGQGAGGVPPPLDPVPSGQGWASSIRPGALRAGLGTPPPGLGLSPQYRVGVSSGYYQTHLISH